MSAAYEGIDKPLLLRTKEQPQRCTNPWYSSLDDYAVFVRVHWSDGVPGRVIFLTAVNEVAYLPRMKSERKDGLA